MEEKKLNIEIQKKELVSHVTKMDSKQDFHNDENSNWMELRFSQLGPDRRSYHSSSIHHKKMYIYGGHDIREGSKDTLYQFDFRKLKAQPEEDGNCWSLIQTKGDEKPGCLAHHSTVIYGDRLFLFGGSNLE